MTTVTLALATAHKLATDCLTRHNTSEHNAQHVANALLAAQIDGQKGHGLSRLPSYCAQSASGKVNGHATPEIVDRSAAGLRIDASNGFAYPAIALAIDELSRLSRDSGIAAASIFRSHHFGQAGHHVEQLAERGLIGLVFGNSPKAIAPWGGNAAIFGTNPIAFAAPRRDREPLMIDLSLSKVARGKVMVAAENDEPIPEGWALDADGNDTTDAKAALQGTMLPMGDSKGAALVLMVEILAAALSGANFGFEASSFFSADGEPPATGQTLLAINPDFFSGDSFSERLEVLLGAITDQPDVRLPGTTRLTNRQQARDGIQIPTRQHEQLLELCAG